MSKSDQIMEVLTKALEDKGVLVEDTDNNLATFIGMSNKRKASIVHPSLLAALRLTKIKQRLK